MTEKRYDVFGVGNAIVDILALVDDDFIREHDLQKGVMTLVDSATQAQLLRALQNKPLQLSSGGSAANTMIGIARCGGNGFYSSKVARDPNGEFYRQDLVSAGIHFDIHPIAEDRGATGTCVVMTTPDAERTMYTHLGASTVLDAGDIDTNRLAECKYAYVEGYLWDGPTTKEASLATMQAAREKGVKLAFSCSDPFCVNRSRDDFLRIASDYCDVIFCNAEEAMALAGKESLNEAAASIGAMVDQVFITNGKEGAIVVSEGESRKVPGFAVDAIDTNGAGDAFAAGSLYALCRGHSPERAARWGNYLASLVVQKHGPRVDKISSQMLAQIATI